MHEGIRDKVELLDSNLVEFVKCPECDKACQQAFFRIHTPWIWDKTYTEIMQMNPALRAASRKVSKKTCAEIKCIINNMGLLDQETFESIKKQIEDLDSLSDSYDIYPLSPKKIELNNHILSIYLEVYIRVYSDFTRSQND